MGCSGCRPASIAAGCHSKPTHPRGLPTPSRPEAPLGSASSVWAPGRALDASPGPSLESPQAECRTEKGQSHRLADRVAGHGHTGHSGCESTCPTPSPPTPHAGRRTARYLPAASPRSADGSPSRQRIRSAQDSRKNTAQGQKLGSESQHQLPGWFLSPLLPFPPTLPNRNSEKISVRGEKGRQELGEGFGVRPGCRHLLNLRSNLLAPVHSSVKQA